MSTEEQSLTPRVAAQTMERDGGDSVDSTSDALYYHSEEKIGKTTFAVWAPKEGTNLPVVLFQSGHLSDSKVSELG